MARFSPDVAQMAREIFTGQDTQAQPPCPDCGGIHPMACPRIASERIVLGAPDNDGTRPVIEREVRYHPPGTWEDHVIFAYDLYEDDDDNEAV